MKLFNVKTREVDPIDDQPTLHKAVLDGTHSFEAGSKINVTSPDGEFGTVPAENVADAVRAGFQIETPSQMAVREYVAKNKGLSGAVKVGLGQAADEALMGLPELVLSKTQDPLEVAKREALKKEHDLANSLGGTVGFLGSLFVGGPLWKGAASAGEKAAVLTAEKLAAHAGEEIGKRTLAKTAKEIAANVTSKAVGAGVEGAVVSLPHAITEAALGDPNDAAETLLAGVGVGALFGGSGALAKDFAKLSKDAAIKGASLITQQEETAKTLARKAAKTLTGVDEDDIAHYLLNPDRVNAAPERELIKDGIDSAISDRRTAVESLREQVGLVRRELDDGYKATKFDLARTKPPEGLADDILGALEEQKAVLGSLSEQADDALERSGLTFRKDDLLSFLDDVGGSIGVESGVGGNKAKSLAAGSMIPLDDQYALVLNTSTTGKGKWSAKTSDRWSVVDQADPEKKLGTFHVRVNEAPGYGDYATVYQADMGKNAGKGIGTKVYGKFKDHYGLLASDADSTSAAAKAVWSKLGGKTMPEDFAKRANELAKSATGEARLMVGKMGPSERVLISDEAVGAVNKLKAQRDRIASLGDEISASQLRQVLREVRKDIQWNRMAGEFNDTLNKARKTFTERVSTVLKDQVPEYGAYMGRMSAISQNLEQASKAFGTKERAVGALNAILSPKGQVKHEALAKLSELTGQNFVGQLDDLKRARGLLEQSRREDIRSQLLPELTGKLQRLEEQLVAAEAAYEPLRRLTPERSQAIIRNQGFKNASIEDRRALEALSAATGQDFLAQIKDRNVLDGFSKDRTNGSRRTLLGTLIGSLAGSPILGGLTGAAVDTHGGEILKRILDTNRNVSGLLFSEKAMKHVGDRLDDIPAMLGRMADRTNAKYARPATSSALARLLISDNAKSEPLAGKAEGSPRLRHLDQANDKASILVSNPELQARKLAELTKPISEGGAPMIGQAFGVKASQALTYLYTAMPKPPRPRSPFAPQVHYKPSNYDLAAFEDKVQIATDPLSALAELEHGTLTRAHVDALKGIYPGILRMIQSKVQTAVVSGVKPLAYAQRLKLSLLLDAPMDQSLTPQAINYYQEPYVAQQAAAAEQSTGGGPAVDISKAYMSQADRITSG